MPVEIKSISSRNDIWKFIVFPNELYKGNSCYVPTIPYDNMTVFDKNKNVAFEFCDTEFFLAYKNNKVVGRVLAIINHKANKKWNTLNVRFGWIDFIDDIEVSKALLDAVAEFGARNGMTTLVGPLGFTDFDPEGMLVEGFDQMGTMSMIYNYPYYHEHMERLGLKKEVDWVEYKITIPDELPEKYYRMAEIIKERNRLKIVKKTRKEVVKGKYGRKLFHLINNTYNILYGYSELSEKQIDILVDKYLGFLDMHMVTFIENDNGELIAAGVTMPSLSKALQKCHGRLFPLGWWYLLKNMFIKRPDTLDMLLVAVRPDYQNKGINSLLIIDLFERFKKLGFKYAETSAELESNIKIQSMWSNFERKQHKRRRVYAKEI